jgi:hypothetical protein
MKKVIFTESNKMELRTVFCQILEDEVPMPITAPGIGNVDPASVFRSKYFNGSYSIVTMKRWKEAIDARLVDLRKGGSYQSKFDIDATEHSAKVKPYELWSEFLDYVIARNKFENQENIRIATESQDIAAKLAYVKNIRNERELEELKGKNKEDLDAIIAEYESKLL